MTILAIDPGNTESGLVIWDGSRVVLADVMANNPARQWIESLASGLGAVRPDLLAIENIGHYGTGMPAGKEVFNTCIWIGRFIEAWTARRGEHDHRLVLRPSIKTHLCGSARAKDPHIRQALIDRLGAPGTKKAPGVTYGVKSHTWAALALALYVADTEKIAA